MDGFDGGHTFDSGSHTHDGGGHCHHGHDGHHHHGDGHHHDNVHTGDSVDVPPVYYDSTNQANNAGKNSTNHANNAGKSPQAHTPGGSEKWLKKNKMAGMAIAFGTTTLGATLLLSGIQKRSAEADKDSPEAKQGGLEMLIGFGLATVGLLTGRQVMR